MMGLCGIGYVGFNTGVIDPVESDVADGIEYGRELSFEGTLATGDLPDAVNVLNTDTVGGSPGRWYPAPENKVEKDYDYGVDGTGSTGTLEAGSGGDLDSVLGPKKSILKG